MTRVALLWHMHQPYYEDLVTREHVLPWVRLHALKDYYGMAHLLREFPQVRVTFNLVPSLLVQLEAFVESRAHDRYLEIGLRPADQLSQDDVTFMLANFFHAHREHMIEPYPRYAELLAQRGQGRSPADLRAAARRFSVDDLRDLQVWQKLAWLDPFYLDSDPRVRDLVDRGRQFSEDDKDRLRHIELELLAAVIPVYKDLAEQGQIEISTSPFYHPILPLLCDTEIYKRTHPDSRMPRHRFVRPEDAAEQLERAVEYHERLFGRRPVGLWPSEGSVSDAMVPLATRAGFEWMATDELILARSLGTTFTRDSRGSVDQPDRLYAPYSVTAGGERIACGFRDHALSDLIGFTYAGWPADRAADDFVARLVEGGRRASATNGGAEPTIFVILDGENVEHFDGGGRPFLRALYGRLARHAELRTVTMAEACRPATRQLPGIFPGSWIDANFYIWIGHSDDHRAWSQLAEARDALDTPATADASAIARAREEILIAEGSDWCWWYGDDHSSDQDAEFDDLFRRHLRNAYRLLERTVPEELFRSNISTGGAAPTHTHPTRLIAPVIDGEETSYFEWLGAGEFDVRDAAGAMHEAGRRAMVLKQIRFGFGDGQLYVRIGAGMRSSDLLAGGRALGLAFEHPAGHRVLAEVTAERSVVRLETRASEQAPWAPQPFLGRLGLGDLIEFAIPLAGLATPGSRLSFVVVLWHAGGTELERHPGAHPIELTVPDASWAARHWSA